MLGRTLLVLSAVTVIALAATLIDHRSAGVESPSRVAPSPPAVVSAPGVVEGVAEEALLRSEVPGVVAERLVAVGDWVEAGQPLVRLDDRAARLRLRSAEAELALQRAARERLLNGAREQERAEAKALESAAASRHTQAVNALNRIEQLERENAIATQEADDARSRAESLRAELAAARARVDQLEAPAREDEVRLADARVAAASAAVELAGVELGKTVIRAPLDARVLDLDGEVGEFLGPDAATPVVVLSDTRQLRVRAFVEELDAPRVPVGASVEVTADGVPGKRFVGRVASLSPRMAVKEHFTERPNELYDMKVREALIDLDPGAELIVGLRVDAWIRCVAPEGTEP